MWSLLGMGEVDDRVEPVGPDDREGAPPPQSSVRRLAGARHMAVVHDVGGGDVGERRGGEAVGDVGAVDDQVGRPRKHAVQPPAPERPHAVPAAAERAVAVPDLGADDLVTASGRMLDSASVCHRWRASTLPSGRRISPTSSASAAGPTVSSSGSAMVGSNGAVAQTSSSACPSSSHRLRIDTPSTSSPRSRSDSRSASRFVWADERDDDDLAAGRGGELARALQQRLGEATELPGDRPGERAECSLGQGERFGHALPLRRERLLHDRGPLLGDVLVVELQRTAIRGLPHRRELGARGPGDATDLGGEAGDVVRRHQEPVDPVGDDLRRPVRHVVADRDAAVAHALDQHQAERLVVAGEQREGRLVELLPRMVGVATQLDGSVGLLDGLAEPLLVRALAPHVERRRAAARRGRPGSWP